MDIKVGVFRSGSNERDFSSFNVIKESLLLLFVEILNFVKVKEYSVRCGKGVKLVYYSADISRACACAV